MKTKQIEAVSFTPGRGLLSYDGQGCIMVRMDDGRRVLIAHATEFGIPFCEPVVRAVNSHDALLEACKDLLDLLKQYDVGQNSAIVERAQSAIRKATQP